MPKPSKADEAQDALIEERPLTDFKTQQVNANLHTERGLAALENSIQTDGWISAVTVAANFEAFDGSARLEKGVQSFDDAIVVHSDGSRPIIHVRDDIPDADHPRARRLGINANRVAQLDLKWNVPLLLDMSEEDGLLTPVMFTDNEMVYLEDEYNRELDEEGKPGKPGDGGDEFDTTPASADGPTRAHRGDIWQIGQHYLMCGDATSHHDALSILANRSVDLLLVDPPYNVGKDYGDHHNDRMEDEEYDAFVQKWFGLWSNHARKSIVTPGYDMFPRWLNLYPPHHVAPWIETNSMTHGNITRFFCWEPILFYGKEGEKWDRRRSNNVWNFPLTVQRMADGTSLTDLHHCPKPLAFWMDLIENFTDPGDIVVDPMSGLGTTLVGCHRLGRKAIIMELSPRYCDVILSRALAEGIGPVQRINADPSEVDDAHMIINF